MINAEKAFNISLSNNHKLCKHVRQEILDSIRYKLDRINLNVKSACSKGCFDTEINLLIKISHLGEDVDLFTTEIVTEEFKKIVLNNLKQMGYTIKRHWSSHTRILCWNGKNEAKPFNYVAIKEIQDKIDHSMPRIQFKYDEKKPKETLEEKLKSAAQSVLLENIKKELLLQRAINLLFAFMMLLLFIKL